MKISKVKNRNLYSANVPKPGGGYKKVYGKTKKEVKEKVEDLSFEIKSGNFVEDNRITLYEWLDEWSKNYLIDVSENTRITYQRAIKQRIKPYLKDKRLQNLTHNDIQSFITRINSLYAPKSVLNAHLVIHRALRDAQRNGYIPFNPADEIILPKIIKTEMTALDKNEIKEFINIAYENEPYYADVFEFMILTGLRVSEISGLTIDNYNSETKVLKVEKQYLRNLKKFTPPKHNVEREIVLSDRAAKIIEKRINSEDPKLNPNKVIFMNKKNGILSSSTISKVFYRIRDKFNKPNLRLHDLRHTFATMVLDSGTDIKTLQELLGHSDATFTMNKYSHSTKLMQVNAAKNLNQYLTQN